MEADVINGNAVKVTPPKKELVFIEDEVSATSFVENVYACVHMITNKSTVSIVVTDYFYYISNPDMLKYSLETQ